MPNSVEECQRHEVRYVINGPGVAHAYGVLAEIKSIQNCMQYYNAIVQA